MQQQDHRKAGAIFGGLTPVMWMIRSYVVTFAFVTLRAS